MGASGRPRSTGVSSRPDEVAPLERAPWPVVLDYFASEHELGEHVAVAGATGEGKTTTILELLQERAKRETVAGWPVAISVLEVKRRDATMSRLLARGWRRIRTAKEWPPHLAEARVVVWPSPGPVAGRARRHSRLFATVLDEIDESGNQIVFIDEAAFFERPLPNGLGLARYLENYWTLARSNGVSLVAGTQRPVRVSRSMWSEPSWLFIFALETEDDLKTIAAHTGSFKQEILASVPTLRDHEFVMIRRRPRSERVAVISRAELR